MKQLSILSTLLLLFVACSSDPTEPKDDNDDNPSSATEFLKITMDDGPLAGKELNFAKTESAGSLSWATLNGGVLSISFGFFEDAANNLDVAAIPMTISGGGVGEHTVIAQGTQIGFDSLWGSFQLTPSDVQAYAFWSLDVELNDPNALVNITKYGEAGGDQVAGTFSTTCKVVAKDRTTLEKTEYPNVGVTVEFSTEYAS